MFSEDQPDNHFVVCAQTTVRAAPLWWIEFETRRAIIAPPIWKQGRCGEPDLSEALINPRHCDKRTHRSLSQSEQIALDEARQLIEAVENGAPLILASRAIGSAFVGISPQFRLDAAPRWADVYASLRIAGQALDDWEIAAELSCGFDVTRWVRLPMGALDAQFAFDVFSNEHARLIGVSLATSRAIIELSTGARDNAAQRSERQNDHDIADLELPFCALRSVRRRYPELRWRLIRPPAPGRAYAIGFDGEGRPRASLRYGDQSNGLSDLLAERICGFAPVDIVAGRGKPPANIDRHSTWIDVG